MLNKISKITNISVIQQTLNCNIYGLNELEYEDTLIGEGGVGSVYQIINIDGETKKGLLIKIVLGEEKAEKSLETVTLLHEKLNDRQRLNKVPIFIDYPELCGLPFLGFKGEINSEGEKVTCFIMYNLDEVGFSDFGSENWDRETYIGKIDLSEKLVLSYQLARTISFLHEIKFIHSDLKDESLFINVAKPKLAIIDYDGGYNYDKQKSALTIGAINAWASSQWLKLIGQGKSASDVSTEERLNEENWIMACAIFELLFGFPPYYFLESNDENEIFKYLKENNWPQINDKTIGLKESNIEFHKHLLLIFTNISELGLSKLTDTFIQVFNDGFKKPKKRLTPIQWKELLYEICKVEIGKPEINNFYFDKNIINHKNELVNVDWDVKYADKIFLNNILQDVFSNNSEIKITDELETTLRCINDFGEAIEKRAIEANKVTPVINYFKSDSEIRFDLAPIKLIWDCANCSYIEIEGLDSNLEPRGYLEVYPVKTTKYTLRAIGHFDQVITESIEIEVLNSEISEFKYEINIEKGIDNIDLIWSTKNALEANISPTVGSVSLVGKSSIRISDKTEFTLKVKGHFNEIQKTIEVQPFPIPIIKGIFIPTPLFNLDLKISSNLLETPVLVNNNINFYQPEIPFREFDSKLIVPPHGNIKMNSDSIFSLFGNLFKKIFKLTNEKTN